MKAPATLAERERLSTTVLAGATMQHATVRPTADHLAVDSARNGTRAPDLGHDFSQVPARTESAACPVSPTRCPFGGACHACPLPVQAKLKVNRPGDRYEREADRAAEEVEHTEGLQLQCRAAKQTEPTHVPPIVREVLRSPGQPLDAATRAFFEPRFGHDFGRVQVHTGTRAAESARAVNALAYTSGRDVVFDTVQYDPQSPSGRRLLAHELTHVIQQTSGRLSHTPGIQRQPRPREERYVPPSARAGRLVYAEEIFSTAPEVRPLTDANFTNIFYDRDKVIVVDFWASWCRPCDDAAAHVAFLARRYASGPYAGLVKFYHVELEEQVNPNLFRRFGFDAIPVVYFYYTGSGQQPSRSAPLLEGSIQGGEASIEDYEWRIQAILRRHGRLSEGADAGGRPALQRKAAPSAGNATRGSLVFESPGERYEQEADQVADAVSQPLDPSVRAFMEPRFGHDFGQVRIHHGAQAAQVTGNMNALAVTRGTDIYLAPDAHAPGTWGGRAIIAHELAHVVQNDVAAAAAPVANLEAEAALTSLTVVAGIPAEVTRGSQEPSLGITRGAQTALWGGLGALGLGAVGALAGLGIAALAGASLGLGALIGAGVGAAVGGLIGALAGFFTRRTERVGAMEADTLIRRRFGRYLPGTTGQRIERARVHPVTSTEMCTWYRCRFPESESHCENLDGWTDTGLEAPNTIASAADEPVCANGRRLEHATPDNPVIYFRRDKRDAGLLVHEGVHAYAHPAFVGQLRNYVNEGVTEYFTRQVLDDVNIPHEGVYDDQVSEIDRLLEVVDEETLARAYFGGEMDALHLAVNNVLGPCALLNWALELQMLSFRRAHEIIEGRGHDYCQELEP